VSTQSSRKILNAVKKSSWLIIVHDIKIAQYHDKVKFFNWIMTCFHVRYAAYDAIAVSGRVLRIKTYMTFVNRLNYYN